MTNVVARRAQLQLAFATLSIEGGLFSPEWLSRVARQEAPGQTGADYFVPKGLTLRDEIGRYWRIAQALWFEFQAGRATSTESPALSERFMHAFFCDVLGFKPEDLERVPIAIATAAEGLNAPSSRFSDGTRRRSAFGAVQEQINDPRCRSRWGIATDGLRLRLLRENPCLTRPAWLEVDLERLFTEELFADFVVAWLVLHESRFGTKGADAGDCWLEVWRTTGNDEGIRAREQLRAGVEAALTALGQGFLGHRENVALRTSLSDGTMSLADYFADLLRLVYRFIFLLTVEERDLLHPTDRDQAALERYQEGYSLRAMRDRSSRRAAHDRHSDQWESVKIVFRGLAVGESRLALPALGGLFDNRVCTSLTGAKLENRDLLDAMFHLGWLRDQAGLVRVNWRDMGPEEFGSIYESLLDLLPQMSRERGFGFAGVAESKGNARKLSSSYYTNDALVQALLDASIAPLVARTIAAHPGDEAAALLRLSIVDPACGSGHFLLGAARRLAAELARVRTNGTPSQDEYRRALRQVISRCVYGVDRNSMAVELCKAALWIESVVPGYPLSFLDSHIRCGDALLGLIDLAALDAGIPSAAYAVRDGDDAGVSAELRQKNRQRVRPISTLPLFAAAAASLQAAEGLPDDTLGDVARKAEATIAAEAESSAIVSRLRADLFCAAFFIRKTYSTCEFVPTSADIDKLALGEVPDVDVVDAGRRIAQQHKFFHWPLMYPDVFARGGFDLVLGNPPWKTMSPDTKEWFAPYDPEVRELAPAEQRLRIEDLLALAGMREAWEAHCHALYDAAAFIKGSGRFRLFAQGNLGKGDFNVYRMFVETALALVQPEGIASQLVPENLYNGANASAIRSALFEEFELRTLIGFENNRHVWFRGIDTRTKFCLYSAARRENTPAFAAAFGVSSAERLDDVRAGIGLISYPVEQVREFSPDALAIAEIAHPMDILIVQKLYERFPKFGLEFDGLATREFMREIDMGNERGSFHSNSHGVPLFEGRMVEAFDYRAKAYMSGHARSAVWRELPFGAADKAIIPQWRIEIGRLPKRIRLRWKNYRIGFCDVGGVTNQRFLMATVIPPVGPCGHSVPTIVFAPRDTRLDCLWLAVCNSFCLDYLARRKAATHMTFTVMDSLPLPRKYTASDLDRALATRALRLCAAGSEMREFWAETAPLLGLTAADSPCEDPVERERLRAEIDALVARDVFSLTRDEMRYLLEPADVLGQACTFETFGALRRAETRLYGEFRTRRLILEAWDNLAASSQLEPVSSIP